MARGVNKVILIGNLGDEPSYRQTSTGTAVVNISMVTNEVRRSMDTQQTTEFAEWHRVVMWGKLADIAHQWLHKGSQIYIEGKLRTRSYTDKQNIKRTITEIVADEMQMLGSKNSSSSYEPTQPQVSESPYPMQNGGYGQQTNTYGKPPVTNSNPYENMQPQAPQNQSLYGSQQSSPYTGAIQGGSIYNNQAPSQPVAPQQPQEPNTYSNTVDGNDDGDDLPF